MRNPPLTGAQVQAYRFTHRRLAHALATGQSVPPVYAGIAYGRHGGVGLVLTALILAGSAVYGALRPIPTIGDAAVLIDTDAGRVFVVSDGVLHPALNLASAQLAAAGTGETAAVRQVNSATVASLPRGPMIGISHAPQQIPAPTEILPSTWTVCDLPQLDPARPADAPTPLSTTVLIGIGAPTVGQASQSAILVTPDGQSYHILSGGQRHRVESPTDGALLRTLSLRLVDARRISHGLLNAIPEGAPIVRPVIGQAGSTVPLGPRQHTVGDVVRVDHVSAAATYHLILADGTQLIPAGAVDVVRAATGSPAEVMVLTPGELAALPVSADPIDLPHYPGVRQPSADPDGRPGLCMDWRQDGAGSAVRIYPVSRLPLPPQARPVAAPPLGPTEQDPSASAPSTDIGVAHTVYLAPQHGLLVRQSIADSTIEIGTLLLITDQGIAYPIVDDQALAALGLASIPISSVPAELISLLPTGPVLDPLAARAVVGGIRPAVD